jgi:hypothetical protein
LTSWAEAATVHTSRNKPSAHFIVFLRLIVGFYQCGSIAGRDMFGIS